ncbi:hypothetical protein HPT25_03990 [Bacillus sp. BRMEA1]|uniref:hypothetical protein n=1 Tax=Neobacillus endophyticus TaxID=2738405 RepID=UPI001566D550|nr:hypothetical protein [Neobacillus endophyticus]NRD76650.1 hypothetical protein [Neobacillus endophyticus]
MNDEYEKGFNEAQKEIAKRLLDAKFKIHYVAQWTGLSVAEVILIRHKKDIERMIKKGKTTDTIDVVLNLPFFDVADAVKLLGYRPSI